MIFKHSFCDPFKEDIIVLEDLPAEKIAAAFDQVPWATYLQKMEAADERDIHFAPSFEIENKETGHGLSISAVGSAWDFEFYIFYTRPKRLKKFFGLISYMDENYVTDITGQTAKDAKQCLDALGTGDINFLENKVK